MGSDNDQLSSNANAQQLNSFQVTEGHHVYDMKLSNYFEEGEIKWLREALEHRHRFYA